MKIAVDAMGGDHGPHVVVEGWTTLGNRNQISTGAVLGAAPQDGARVVVHERGTFTSVAGADGASLDWRPLAGPSDLPSFVYDLSNPERGLRFGEPIEACTHKDKNQCKGCTEGTIRMETPVLYFYSDRETTMSVKVDFPKGRITEWYPAARNVDRGIAWGGVAAGLIGFGGLSAGLLVAIGGLGRTLVLPEISLETWRTAAAVAPEARESRRPRA